MYNGILFSFVFLLFFFFSDRATWMKKFFYTKFFSSLKRDFSCLEIVFSFSFSSEAKSVLCRSVYGR